MILAQLFDPHIGREGFELVREPPAFAVHVTVGDGIASHIQPVT